MYVDINAKNCCLGHFCGLEAGMRRRSNGYKFDKMNNSTQTDIFTYQ